MPMRFTFALSLLAVVSACTASRTPPQAATDNARTAERPDGGADARASAPAPESPDPGRCKLDQKDADKRSMSVTADDDAWCPLVTDRSAALFACYADLFASVSACRSSGSARFSGRPGPPIDFSLVVSKRDPPKAKPATALEAMPARFQSSPDKCLDDYDRTEAICDCVQEVLSKDLGRVPNSALHLSFTQHDLGGLGGLGR